MAFRIHPIGIRGSVRGLDWYIGIGGYICHYCLKLFLVPFVYNLTNITSGVVFMFSDVVEDMMGFYLALFQGLRVQMGIPSIQSTISIFVSLFTR